MNRYSGQENSQFYCAKGQPILFLPIEGGSAYITVHESLLQNEDTCKFLEQLGIKKPSLREEIYNIILPQYDKVNSNAVNADFVKFFQCYLDCPQNQVKDFLDQLRGHNILLCRSSSIQQPYHEHPSELYFPSEFLQSWFAGKPTTPFVCFDEYLDLVGQDKEESLKRFFTDLGVKETPRLFAHTLSEKEAYEIKPSSEWARPSQAYGNTRKWSERSIDGCQENIQQILDCRDSSLLHRLSIALWNHLLKLIADKILDNSVLFGQYEYFNRSPHNEPFESRDAVCLRRETWLMNSHGSFVSAKELTRQTLSPRYDLFSNEALVLLRILGIEDKEVEAHDDSISSFAERLGLTEEEQRRALKEFAERKRADDDALRPNPFIERVVKDIAQRVSSAPAKPKPSHDVNGTVTDEDDFSKPTVDIEKKIEKVKEQAERNIKEIAHLEELRQKAQQANKYSFAWFKTLLEWESLNSGENSTASREISISFAKVELEAGTSRTLVLKHPNRYIPQSMEDLADIPLELHFADKSVSVAVEVVNVKSYTLRAKLRTNAKIDGLDLSRATEARIDAKNPVFLIEELRKAFIHLGSEKKYSDDFDMQKNLCENIEFVFGPPGTGKTTHLVNHVIIPRMKERQDFKVLVLTPTNKAADVLTRRIIECMGNDQSYKDWLVRFGTTSDEIVEQSGVFRDKTTDIRSFPRNVTITTMARFPYDYFLPDDGTRLHLNALKWDVIVIDEASMIPLANIIYPLYKKTPEKFIIAGDPFQIEPITSVNEWKDENIYTMIELRSFTTPTTIPHDYHVELLTTQYRSVPEIGEVFSRFAYGGVLKHDRKSEGLQGQPVSDCFDLQPISIIKFPVSKYESIYRPKRLQGKSSYQVYSALFAFELVKYLTTLIELPADKEKFKIGLIAPYRAQADLIDRLMASAVIPKQVDVQVGTIHGFQGDECDLIIALFNPPPDISTHKEMFLNKLNIVNVSISRARDYLIVLMPDDQTENVRNLELIKIVERLCKQQPTCTEQLSPNVENIILGSSTYLEENAFSTSHQLVNVYGKPEKRYEVRSEENAVDVQIHE